MVARTAILTLSWVACTACHPAPSPAARAPAPEPTAVAVVMYDDAGARLYIADLGRAGLTPIGPDGEAAHQPVWSPDGTRLAYRVGDRLLVHTEGASPDPAIADGIEIETRVPCAFSPDGRRLAIVLAGGVSVATIGPGAAISPPAPLASFPGRKIGDLQWSPDGGTLVALVTDPAPSDAAQLAWIPMTGAARLDDARGTSRLLGWRTGGELLTVETSDSRQAIATAPARSPRAAPPFRLPAGENLFVLDHAREPDRLVLARGGEDTGDDATVVLAPPAGAPVRWLASHPRLTDLQLTPDGTWAVFVDRATGGERPGGSVYIVRVGSDDARLVLPASAARSFSAPVPRPDHGPR